MIYLLEDDDSIRKLVIYALQSQGYEAAGFERPSEFWHAVNRKLPELVLLLVQELLQLVLLLLELRLWMRLLQRLQSKQCH